MSPFLTAEWRHLVMLNFAVDPELLLPLVPDGTELDSWNDRAYLSVVGFRFLGSRLYGVPVPFHSRFEQINLRFYVKRSTPEGDRRGVVFIREFAPRPAVAGVARWLYEESYVTCQTRHDIELGTGQPDHVEYRWKVSRVWNSVRAEGLGEPTVPAPGSEEEFITEHYWGYTALNGGRCREYEVRHEPWKIRRAQAHTLECDVASVYDGRFVDALGGEPSSGFVAEGSEVTVYRGRLIA